MTGTPPRRWLLLAALRAAAALLLAATACTGTTTAIEAANFTAHADRICEAGRARLRADPSERDSTKVLTDMERALRALGPPPPGVAALGSDVPLVLATVTWASESFQVAASHTVGDLDAVTVEQLEELGFRVCGQQ